MKSLVNWLKQNISISHFLILSVIILVFGMIIKKDNTEYFTNSGKLTSSCQKPTTSTSTSTQQKCTSKCSENTDLLPIMDPLFNMRECVKQCILLEDHLFQKKKRCEDCIKKHFLTIEGLAEEAISLDKENQHNLGDLKLADNIRQIEKKYINDEDPINIAQSLRQIRKPLMVKYFANFE